jgi:hypothetical protein
MKTLKTILEDDFDTRMAAQKARQEAEHNLEGRLSAHYDGPVSQHLRDYTAMSGKINGHLWDKGSSTEHDQAISALDHATHEKKTPESFTAYSKSRHDPRELQSNGVVHHPAYLSTSIKQNVVSGQYQGRNVEHKDGIKHHHIMNIHVPEGSPGVYINYHSNVDNRAKEFLLPRGSNLQYHSTDTKKDNVSKNHYHTHHMSLIK